VCRHVRAFPLERAVPEWFLASQEPRADHRFSTLLHHDDQACRADRIVIEREQAVIPQQKV